MKGPVTKAQFRPKPVPQANRSPTNQVFSGQPEARTLKPWPRRQEVSTMPSFDISRSVTAGAVALALAACATTPPSPHGKPGPSVNAGVTVTAGISVGNARALAVQYGLTGAKPLPPGIAKKVARGQPLPPGIAKTRLPPNFVQALPQHPGYEWQQSGPDLVLVVSGTLVISDILHGVFH
jgi:hypothetical protein